MHHFPVAIYTVLAAMLFLGGIYHISLFEGPKGEFSHLCSAVVLLLMACGTIYGGLILKDDWKSNATESKKPPIWLLPSKKEHDA